MKSNVENRETPSNTGRIALLAATAMCLGTAVTWFSVSSLSLCIGSFNADIATYGVTAGMLALPIIGLLHSRLGRIISLKRMFIVTYVALAAVLVGFWGFAAMFSAEIASPGMVFFMKLLGALSFVPLSQLVSRAFPGEEGCKPSLLVIAGFPIAQMIGGASAGWMIDTLGATSLLPASLAGLAAAGICVVIYVFRYGVPSESNTPAATAPNAAQPVNNTRLLAVLIAASALLIALAVGLISHLFRSSAQSYFAGSGELAGCLGGIETVSGAIELAMMIFLSSRIIRRFGVAPGLVIFPALLAVGAAAMLACDSLHLGAIFWVAAAARVFESVFRPALFKPSLKLLVDLFSVKQRMGLIARIETVHQPIATAAAGGLVLLFSTVLHLGTSPLLVVLLAITGLCVLAGTLAYRSYLATITPPAAPATSRVRTAFAAAASTARSLAVKPAEIYTTAAREMASSISDISLDGTRSLSSVSLGYDSVC